MTAINAASIISRARERMSREPVAPICLGVEYTAAKHLDACLSPLGGWAEAGLRYDGVPQVRFGRQVLEEVERDQSVGAFSLVDTSRSGCIYTVDARYSLVVEAVLYGLPGGGTTQDLEEWLVQCVAVYLHFQEQQS